jgi:hypothetical protein
MKVDSKTLESKIREMYPEIVQHDLSLSMNFDEGTDSWIVKIFKGPHNLATHLEKKDAEACLEGIQCIYLGVQIGQFVKNFELEE